MVSKTLIAAALLISLLSIVLLMNSYFSFDAVISSLSSSSSSSSQQELSEEESLRLDKEEKREGGKFYSDIVKTTIVDLDLEENLSRVETVDSSGKMFPFADDVYVVKEDYFDFDDNQAADGAAKSKNQNSNTAKIPFRSAKNNNKFEYELLFSPEFKESNEKLKDFCAHPKNCYSAKCYAPLSYVGGGCFPSPYHSDIVDAVRKRLELTTASDTRANISSRRDNNNSSIVIEKKRKIRSFGEPLRIIIVTTNQNFQVTMQPWIISYFAKRVPALFGPTATVEWMSIIKLKMDHQENTARNHDDDRENDEKSKCRDADVLIAFSDNEVLPGVEFCSELLPHGAIFFQLYPNRNSESSSGFHHQHQMLEHHHPIRANLSTSTNQRHFHVSIQIPLVNQRRTPSPKEDQQFIIDVISGPGGHFFDEIVMKPILCLMKHNTNKITKSPENSNSDDEADVMLVVPEKCTATMATSTVLESTKRQVEDSDIRSYNIARAASAKLFPTRHITAKNSLQQHDDRPSHRLQTIIKYRKRIGDVLEPFIYTTSTNNNDEETSKFRPRGMSSTKILIIEPCAARRSFVLPEASALCQILQKCNDGKIHVAEYALGKDTCEMLEEQEAIHHQGGVSTSRKNTNNVNNVKNNINDNDSSTASNKKKKKSTILTTAAEFLLPAVGERNNVNSGKETGDDDEDWLKLFDERVVFFDYEHYEEKKHGVFDIIIRDILELPPDEDSVLTNTNENHLLLQLKRALASFTNTTNIGQKLDLLFALKSRIDQIMFLDFSSRIVAVEGKDHHRTDQEQDFASSSSSINNKKMGDFEVKTSSVIPSIWGWELKY